MAITPLPVARAVTYRQYVAALAHLENPNQEVAFSLSPVLLKFVEAIKPLVEAIKELGVSTTDVFKALKSKDLYALLRAVKFNLTTIMKALKAASSLISHGILKVFEVLASTGVINKLRDGTLVIDQLLDQYPILKHVAGPALAGLLVWMWLNMSFVGDFSYDFDLGMAIKAFLGHFSLYDLFVSPNGLAFIGLFAAGSLTGLTFPWLLSSTASLLLALVYTGLIHLRQADAARHVKKLLKVKRYST